MLKNRIITTIWAVPLISVIIWFGEPYFTIAMAAVGLLAALEFYRLSKDTRAQALSLFGIIWTILFIVIRNPGVVTSLAPYINPESLIPAAITLGMFFSLTLLLARREKNGAFLDWSWTFAEILYLGWFLGYFVALRGLDGGRNWVFLAILAEKSVGNAIASSSALVCSDDQPRQNLGRYYRRVAGSCSCQFIIPYTDTAETHCLSQLVATDPDGPLHQRIRASRRLGRIIV